MSSETRVFLALLSALPEQSQAEIYARADMIRQAIGTSPEGLAAFMLVLREYKDAEGEGQTLTQMAFSA